MQTAFFYNAALYLIFLIRHITSPIVQKSRNIRQVQVFISVIRDVALAALEVVAQEEVEDLGGALHVLGHDLDEPPGGGGHGGQGHHLRVVLAQTLGALDLILLPGKLSDFVVLLLVGVGEEGIGHVLAGDLVQGAM